MMSQTFHTILIRDVPRLNMKVKSLARRFITLIDTLYDNRVIYLVLMQRVNFQHDLTEHDFLFSQVRVVISSDYHYTEIFRNDPQDRDSSIPDEDRSLMDDLGINQGTEGSNASIFTGEEELFASDRTVSRLAEMQTRQYWEAWERT